MLLISCYHIIIVNRAREHRRRKTPNVHYQDGMFWCCNLFVHAVRNSWFSSRPYFAARVRAVTGREEAMAMFPASRNLRFRLFRAQFVIPLMLVFITARAVGNHFNQGIYDTQISIKKMPFLEQVGQYSMTSLRFEQRATEKTFDALYFCFTRGRQEHRCPPVPALQQWTGMPSKQYLERFEICRLVLADHWAAVCLDKRRRQ